MTNITFKSKRHPKTADKLNEMARRMDLMTRGIESSHLGTNIAPPKRQYLLLGYPWLTNVTFGLERTAPNKITVHLGKLRRLGDQTYSCAATEVEFTGDGDAQQIVWKWNPTDGLVIDPTPTTGAVSDDSTWIRGVLSEWDVLDGYAELVDYLQCGVIILPVFSAPGV